MPSSQTRTSFSHDDLVYLAGFFDGEGMVNITRIVGKAKEPQYKLQLSITNTSNFDKNQIGRETCPTS